MSILVVRSLFSFFPYIWEWSPVVRIGIGCSIILFFSSLQEKNNCILLHISLDVWFTVFFKIMAIYLQPMTKKSALRQLRKKHKPWALVSGLRQLTWVKPRNTRKVWQYWPLSTFLELPPISEIHWLEAAKGGDFSTKFVA